MLLRRRELIFHATGMTRPPFFEFRALVLREPVERVVDLPEDSPVVDHPSKPLRF